MEKALVQRQSDCIKIVLFGPESTGKTTLAGQLATHFNTEWVPEFMRGYLQDKWNTSEDKISKEDLLPIAIGQMAIENEIAENAKKIIFCDTNLLELQVYCEYYYKGWCPPAIVKAVENQSYDFYFLTNIDVQWQADDLRDRPNDRFSLFCNFEEALKKRNLPYKILSGNKEKRLQEAVSLIEKRFSLHEC